MSESGKGSRSASQLLRFLIVGLLSNAAGYLLYLAITYAGVAPKLAMTVLYVVGAALGFAGNRAYTFSDTGALLSSSWKYLVVHCAGYSLNLLIQVLVVDYLGHPHQLAQAIGVGVVAAFLFLAFKYFVFSGGKNSKVQSRGVGDGATH